MKARQIDSAIIARARGVEKHIAQAEDFVDAPTTIYTYHESFRHASSPGEVELGLDVEVDFRV